jgi:hypothetical protein
MNNDVCSRSALLNMNDAMEVRRGEAMMAAANVTKMTQ